MSWRVKTRWSITQKKMPHIFQQSLIHHVSKASWVPYLNAEFAGDELDKGMYMKETYYRYQESFRTIEGAVAPAKDCVDECLKNESISL